MHQWGDEWFQKNGNDLYSAIEKFEKICRRYGKIAVCGKEKWGCYRDDYLSFWDGGLHYIIYNSPIYIRNSFIYWKLDKYIIKPFTQYTKLLKLGQWYQSQVYNYAMQRVCRKYPNVVEELIRDIEGYYMIKPGIFGKISGEDIHNKYWKKV